MTNRLLLWSGALALSAVAFASSKTYDVVLTSAAKAGSTQLAPGEYKLKVDGSNAIFTGWAECASRSPYRSRWRTTKPSTTRRSVDTTTKGGTDGDHGDRTGRVQDQAGVRQVGIYSGRGLGRNTETVLEGMPSTVKTKSAKPPLRVGVRRRVTWSRPGTPLSFGPAYSTGTLTPPMVHCTFASEERLRMPVA